MRLITLEEHYRSERVNSEIGAAGDYFRTANSAGERMAAGRLANLSDLGERRLADMDKSGIDMQVLSHTHPSPEILPGPRAIPLCRIVNDELAGAVARYPRRFAAFATLPVADPVAAASELEWAAAAGFKGALINGLPQGRFLDHRFFTPLLERAEALGMPIYLHPAPPPEPVREAYFSGLEPGLARMLSIAGWGWHAELGLHTIRMIANGVFDRHPNLQIIIGHMGEMIPFYLARVNAMVTPFANLPKQFADYFHSNIHITTSGITALPPFHLCLEVVGIDRLLFSVDYPYSPNEAGREFLERITLAPVDFEKFTHGNAEKLLKIA